MLGVPRNVAAAIWMGVVVTGFVGIAAYSADWDHFTWWFQATFTVVGLVAIVGLDAYIFFFFQVIPCRWVDSRPCCAFIHPDFAVPCDPGGVECHPDERGRLRCV